MHFVRACWTIFERWKKSFDAPVAASSRRDFVSENKTHFQYTGFQPPPRSMKPVAEKFDSNDVFDDHTTNKDAFTGQAGRPSTPCKPDRTSSVAFVGLKFEGQSSYSQNFTGETIAPRRSIKPSVTSMASGAFIADTTNR